MKYLLDNSFSDFETTNIRQVIGIPVGSDGKKVISFPFIKKKKTNYCPVFLLPICGKIFERLIFNEMLRFFLENKLITPHQFGFKTTDSCINQLLLITHEIYKSFMMDLRLGVYS